MPASPRAGWALGAAGFLLVAFAGFALETRHAALNLGPGDTPFVSGFARDHDVAEKTGWHWTTYDAAVDLPLQARGSALDVRLRYARMFGEEALVEVSVSGVATDTFRARGGEVRVTSLRAGPVSGPLRIGLRTESHERRNMGLRMDSLQIDVASGPGLRLTPRAALRPVLVAALFGGGLLLLGSGPLGAGAGVLGFGLIFGFLARADLFGAWRMTQEAPTLLVLSVAVLLAARVVLERLRLLGPAPARVLAAASLGCMLFRLGLVSQPDFYYPDLMTHARVVETIRSEGPRFFADPAKALAAQGAWTKPVMGAVSSLPYAVVFHAPFAVPAAAFDWSRDEIETALKSVSCLISALPILLAGALAFRLGLPPESALALAIIPTHASRLSLALLPSLTGHVFDLVALLVLAVVFGRGLPPSPRATAVAALALFAGHLSYTASVINEGVFSALFAVLLLVRGRGGASLAARVVAAEALAALLAFTVYYRSFVGDVFALAGRLTGAGASTAGGPSTGSVYPVESFWAVLSDRTGSYFGWTWTGLAILIVVIGPRARDLARSTFVQAWVLSYLVLILLRAKIPDVFRYGHETVFLMPLVAVAAASSLKQIAARGRAARLVAALAGGGLILVSVREQLAAFAAQLANAR